MRLFNRTMLLLGTLIVLPLTGADAGQVTVDSEKAVVIEGVISRGNIAQIGDELLKRAESGDKSVDLVINSPGGEVVTGFLFINKLEEAKALGLHVRCFVPEVAASMAFSILTHCNERFALERTFLLWHRARVSMGGMFGGVPMTAPDLLKLGKDLATMDQVILDEVLGTMDASGAFIRYHFDAETLHVASNLHAAAPKFITVYKNIPGLYAALNNKSLVRTKEASIFGMFEHGSLIYISPYINVLNK